VVLGVDDEKAGEILRELHTPFVRTGNAILVMDVSAAEITKYAANAMLATRISFMNAIAQLCEATGADIDMVRRGIGTDSRIGRAFLFPGVGYGGSCFPKDVKALIRTMDEEGADASILKAVEAVNEAQKGLLVRQVLGRYGEDLTGRTFAVWGLAFKPNTDDMREAPSLVTIDALLERGARIQAHDPVAMNEARRILGDRIGFSDNNYAALEGSDALLIHTEWLPYRRPDFVRIKNLLKAPVIFDGRNIFHPDKMRSLGYDYYSVGRRPVERAG
jgi:UDPglucose 6-dehydrogenase